MSEKENIEYNKTLQLLWTDTFRLNNVAGKAIAKINELSEEYAYHKSNYNQPEVEKCLQEIQSLRYKIETIVGRLRNTEYKIMQLNPYFKLN